MPFSQETLLKHAESEDWETQMRLPRDPESCLSGAASEG